MSFNITTYRIYDENSICNKQMFKKMFKQFLNSKKCKDYFTVGDVEVYEEEGKKFEKLIIGVKEFNQTIFSTTGKLLIWNFKVDTILQAEAIPSAKERSKRNREIAEALLAGKKDPCQLS